jgi:imidazolonepropionase-like amidohydrolase
VLGLEHCKGRIAAGYDADLVLLDDDGTRAGSDTGGSGDTAGRALRPWAAPIVGGRVVFRQD